MKNDHLSGKIEFIQYEKPNLTAGDYRITVTQTVKPGANNGYAEFTDTAEFSINGPRFDLPSQDIFAVYPPAGSLGDSENVLPHIILNRSTLPWERDVWAKIVKTDSHEPWLALLVLHENELNAPSTDIKVIPPQVLTLSELLMLGETGSKVEQGHKVWFPEFAIESSQKENDSLTVIDVRRDLLEAILPTTEDLNFLAHIRVRKEEDSFGEQVATSERAVIIGNRLPRQNGSTTVHLISLENRFTESGFDYQSADPKDFIRLVTLKSWSFACVDSKYSFKGLLMGLDRELYLKLSQPSAAGIAEPYLSRGYVPLPHFLRKGDKTLSWYRGPFVTGYSDDKISDLPLPAQTSDQLLRFEYNQGTFDVSYAAAWQLGRQIAMQDTRFAVGLFNWKRLQVQREARSSQFEEYSHISPHVSKPDSNTTEPPAEVEDGFKRLNRLQGVPFNYLVPDERMLPYESIRFFRVDPQWIASLLDGAFSMGRVIKGDEAHDRQHPLAKIEQEEVSGFLLRSDVVVGWPGLLVDGYDKVEDGQKLKILRKERLSPSVLLCLFEGRVNKVDIHLEPETLHFGLKEGESAFSKDLKTDDGTESGQPINVPFRDTKAVEPSVIDIARLATEIGKQIGYAKFTSAQFALQMIEGEELVSFTLTETEN